jgi:hypothetical protein
VEKDLLYKEIDNIINELNLDREFKELNAKKNGLGLIKK